ncbi:MAG TPA: Ppx/GppA phosphatase family protein [Blastocatellia bacterium]|nr:Ppx/GppA phosphatase family protein [Blastocatellia bacterium]
MKLAAIDIGSNSIHLVIVRAVKGQRPEIIDREKEMVRVGSGTLREHRLSNQTIERAITTLQRFKKMAEHNGADPIIATATAAVRESRNADEFIEQVRKEVGINVQVLPGVEEARLIALAVSEVTDFNGKRALIIDIGGGSTEFIITGGADPELLLSLRVGAVRLTEKFITTDPISTEQRDRLIANIRSDFTRAASEIKSAGYDFVIGTSGTVLNMVEAAAHTERPHVDESLSDFESFSQTVTLKQIERLNHRLCRMKLRERKRVPGIEKGRADIIIAGGLLLECILSDLGAAEITSCDWSLREGVVLDYLRRRRELHPRPEAARGPQLVVSSLEDKLLYPVTEDSDLDVRARSVLSVARRYGYDATHSHHVARLATQIFEDTKELHGLSGQDRKLLQYAAILHDIGYHIAHNNHHRHGLYLIKNSEMPGFTGDEIAMMSTLVRYHRGSLPRKTNDKKSRREHEEYHALDRQQRTKLLQLASILQIADGLDRSHRQSISDVRCTVADGTVTLVAEYADECELEMWSAERKSDWFKNIFDVSLRFERIPAVPTRKESVAGLVR